MCPLREKTQLGAANVYRNLKRVSLFCFSSQELLKHTPPDHPDHEPLQAAVQVMRDVASSINERKRKVENLSSIAEWQLGVEAWQVRTRSQCQESSFQTATFSPLFSIFIAQTGFSGL